MSMTTYVNRYAHSRSNSMSLMPLRGNKRRLNLDSRHIMRRRAKISISLFKKHSKRKISKCKIYLRFRRKFSKRELIMR